MSLNGKEEEFGYFINNNNIDIALVMENMVKSKYKSKLCKLRCNSIRFSAYYCGWRCYRNKYTSKISYSSTNKFSRM